MTVREAAKLIPTSEAYVRILLANRTLKGKKKIVGRNVMWDITEESLENYIRGKKK